MRLAQQAKRDRAAKLPAHRRPPLGLEVQHSPEGGLPPWPGCSVQLLSLADTFASVGRLADRSPAAEPNAGEVSPRGRTVYLAQQDSVYRTHGKLTCWGGVCVIAQQPAQAVSCALQQQNRLQIAA